MSTLNRDKQIRFQFGSEFCCFFSGGLANRRSQSEFCESKLVSVLMNACVCLFLLQLQLRHHIPRSYEVRCIHSAADFVQNLSLESCNGNKKIWMYENWHTFTPHRFLLYISQIIRRRSSDWMDGSAKIRRQQFAHFSLVICETGYSEIGMLRRRLPRHNLYHVSVLVSLKSRTKESTNVFL